MPTTQGLWAGEEGAPCRPGEDAAGRGENDPIRRLPPWAGNLAFEDAELMMKNEDLGAELGLGVAADDQDVEHEADEGIDEGAGHDR
jgi:hypothetical protein